MAFRIRKKRKGSQIAKRKKAVMLRNDKTDKEKQQELAELDAIAESSGKPQRGESNIDSLDEEP